MKDAVPLKPSEIRPGDVVHGDLGPTFVISIVKITEFRWRITFITPTGKVETRDAEMHWTIHVFEDAAC